MRIVKTTNMKDWQAGFDEGALAERSRLIAYLVEKSIIRRDALGYWVKETMSEVVTELPDLELEKLPKRKDGNISIDPAEIGAMMSRLVQQNNAQVRDRLLELRKLSDAGSPVSIAISEWVKEIG